MPVDRTVRKLLSTAAGYLEMLADAVEGKETVIAKADLAKTGRELSEAIYVALERRKEGAR